MKRVIVPLLAAAALWMATSCSSSDLFDPANTQNQEHTTDLQVPANFDWATTRSLTLSVTSPVNTVINLYTDEACSADHLLASVSLAAHQATTIPLETPCTAEAVYIQYPTESGHGVIKQALASTRLETKVDYTIALPEDATFLPASSTTYGDYAYYMPSKNTMGTLMFEDQYPQLGDYDMNDFVIGYYIEAVSSIGIFSTEEGTDIDLQIRAIGGVYPYRFCVELPVQANDIQDASGTYYTVTSNDSRISATLISSGMQKAIFAINGTNALKEGTFFNTEKLTSLQALPKVHIAIRRDNKDEFSRSNRFKQLTWSYQYNFFLQHQTTHMEIHLRGYKPTALSSYPDAEFNSKENLVWGLKVPQLIDHPKEGEDIMTAYGHFKEWVLSGGDKKGNWYHSNIDQSKVIDMDNFTPKNQNK